MGDKSLQGFWLKNFEDLHVDGRAILKLMLNRMGGLGLDSSGSRWCPIVGCCEHGNEPSDSHKTLGSSWLAEQLVASQKRFCCL
jgi:hypothetical protein